MNNLQEKKWSVEIFRYSTDRGWELYQQKQTKLDQREQQLNLKQVEHNRKKQNLKEDRVRGSKKIHTQQGEAPCANGTTSGKLQHRVNNHNPGADSTDDDDGITAVPRRGCVEVKKLRLRIHLFKNKGNTSSNHRLGQQRKKRGSGISSNNSNNSKTNSDKKDEGAHTTVVRRRDTILLSSRRGLGAVVLKFRSVADCIAFSDRLIELNADYVYNQTDDKSVQRPMKRSKATNSNCNSRADGANNVEASDSSSTKNSGPKEKEEDQDNIRIQNNGQDCRAAIESSDNSVGMDATEVIRSYMVRLLHDEDFLGFVDNVENSLASAPDTSKILEALAFARTRR